MHNYIVFDHCQLFGQHTWPNFIFCHNIGIVKVSHKKLTSTFHTPLSVCVYPPQIDYLHKCIVFDHCQLFLQLFPQHTWPEFIFCHNIGIVKVSHTNLTSDIHIPRAVSVFPKNKLTICTITKSLTIANFSTIYLATIHILPQHRHCKEHKNLKSSFHTSPCLCVAPPQGTFAQLHNLWTMPTFLTT